METLKTIYDSFSNVIAEPTTAATDLLLSFFAVKCGVKLNKLTSKWHLFFLFMACSTFLGAVAHSISFDHISFYYKTSWLLMQLFAGVSLFFAQQAAFSSEIQNVAMKKNLGHLAFIQLFCFMFCVMLFMDFKVVAVNSLIGLLQLIIVLFPKSKERFTFHAFATFGLLISFLTVYINQHKVSLVYWFNHNDISHVIMFVSLFFIYRGILSQHKERYIPN